MEDLVEYKHIIIEKTHSTGKTYIFRVTAKDGHIKLGDIRWFPSWRKYGFFPADDTVYEQTCLTDIADFLTELMKERKQNKTT